MESVEEALRFLAKQFESVELARAQWSDEKKQYQQHLQELQAQKKIQDDHAKELMLQIKMLEFALQTERGRYAQLIPTKPQDKQVSRTIAQDRGLASPTNSPKAGGRKKSKEHNIKHSSSPGSQKHMESLAKSSESEISRGTSSTTASVNSSSVEVARNDPIVPQKETLISRPHVSSKADSSKSITTPPAPPKPPAGPPAVEVSTKVSGNFRACKLKQKLSGHLDGVRSVCFHPTDPFLASGSEDATVKIWNVSSKYYHMNKHRDNDYHDDSHRLCLHRLMIIIV
jgi:hypothetical protein